MNAILEQHLEPVLKRVRRRQFMLDHGGLLVFGCGAGGIDRREQ